MAQNPGAPLIGRVPIAQVPAYLAAAHVVVVPQRDSSDTRGQVRPSCSTRWPSAGRCLDAGVHDPGRSSRAAGSSSSRATWPGSPRRSSRLLDRPEEARALGEAARRRAVERYSFESARAALFPLVERVRARRSRPGRRTPA